MGKIDRTKNAVDILRRRYVKGDPAREAALETERTNLEVARMIYELRSDAGLSQSGLAELVGTTQSAISRLEDADYEGHSLSMLNRIAKALNQRLTVLMTAKDPEAGTLRFAFRTAMQDLRRAKGLTIDELSAKTGVDRDEIAALERNEGYRPSPLTIHLLAKFYGLPERNLAALAGAFQNVPNSIREHASRFAAQSESFAKLTKEEQKMLDEFINALKKEQ